jgi:large subunit ribosomal protein L4
VQATIYNLKGETLDTVELNDAIYGIEPNIAVVHQAVLRQQANARLGTHNTLTRAHVSGGGRKPWRQKGTGRARQGSTRSPQWRHGGVVFGPHPRSYEQTLPRKMRRLAMRSVISAKAADGQILVVDSFETQEPRTKAMVTTLAALNLAGRRVLIMTPTRLENVELAAGNLPRVRIMRTAYLSLVAMLKAEVLLLDRASLDVIESILGQTGGRNSRPINALDVTDDEATTAGPRVMLSPMHGGALAPATPTAITPATATAVTPAGATAVASPAPTTMADLSALVADDADTEADGETGSEEDTVNG